MNILALLLHVAYLDAEVAVDHVEAGEKGGDEVGLVRPDETGGLVELCQHLLLADQQLEVVRQFLLHESQSEGRVHLILYCDLMD